jgi:hypothetical protein
VRSRTTAGSGSTKTSSLNLLLRRSRIRQFGSPLASRIRYAASPRAAANCCSTSSHQLKPSASALYGTPDRIAVELEALRAVGVEYVLLHGGESTRQSIRRFSTEIMPAFTRPH